MGYLLPFGRNIQLGQPFGSRPNMPPNPAGGHNGDDWLTVVGVPVRAAGDGVVVFAGQFDSTYADNFGWSLHYGGLQVVLKMDGKHEPYFEYGHNSRLMVKTGDRVKRGQIIAYTGNTDGNTGISTGPHCHVGCLPWNYNLNTNTYGRVNPRLFMTDYWDESQLSPQGTATPIQEENPLANFTEKDVIRLVKAGIDDWTMTSRVFEGNRNARDAYKQSRIEHTNIQRGIAGIKPGVAVDIDELAKSLSEQLEAKDITALAAKLQITVKDAQ